MLFRSLLIVRLRAPAAAAASIVTLTVSDVADVNVTELTVIPVPENVAVAPDWKPVPATTRFWLTAPCPREAGVTDVTVGGVTTVKPPVRLLAPLSGLVTVTSRRPTVAVEATVTLTSNCVELTNVAVLTEIPVPENVTAAPLTKLVPVTVTVWTAAPAPIADGDRLVTVGPAVDRKSTRLNSSH